MYETVRVFALAFPATTEGYPFGPDDLVFKAANGKMFALLAEDDGGVTRVTMKLALDEAAEALLLPFVAKAPYLGRHGWVTATLGSPLEWEIAQPWVERSHELVTGPKPRKPKTGPR